MGYLTDVLCIVITINSLIIILYIAQRLALASLSHLKGRECISGEHHFPGDPPTVTIQLPIFNERYVVKRLLESVILIEYPKDKLDIQVLDDSTDDTRDILADQVHKLQQKGWNIRHLHRTDRSDYKAGALRAGLESAQGDYVAIFDADFIPDKQFLRKTVPVLLADENIGMVQTRWGHTNEFDSYMTQAQAVFIDTHYLIEQVGRNASGLWMNFNGTAGIWRKDAIIDAGNWSGDTLTEDLDLSYRALLKGWRFKYLNDVVNPAELPPTIAAFRSQQFRWAKGSMQTAIKLLPLIWSSRAPLRVKAFSTFHMLAYGIHSIELINIILLPILLFLSPKISAVKGGDIANIDKGTVCAVSIISITCSIIYYLIVQHKRGQKLLKILRQTPATLFFALGLSVNNCLACAEAIIGRKSEFVRTPKFNLIKPSNSKDSIYTKFQFKPVVAIEAAASIYVGLSAFLAYKMGYFIALPIFLVFFFGWVVFLTETLRMSLVRRTV